jgi:hypothetical protein
MSDSRDLQKNVVFYDMVPYFAVFLEYVMSPLIQECPRNVPFLGSPFLAPLPTPFCRP